MQRLSLLAICDIADKRGVVWAGQEHIAAMTGLTARSIRSSLKTFEAGGLISRKARFKPDGGRTSDWITVHCPALGRAEMSEGERQTAKERPEKPPERHSPPHRKEIPEAPGINFRESDHDETTRSEPSNIDRVIELEFERFPEPDGSSDVHNRAKSLLDKVYDALEGHLDFTSPGIQNTTMLKQWVTLYDCEFLVNQIRLVAERKPNGSLIRSWRYFARAIERAATERPGAPLDDKRLGIND